jgi:hypothetical protein
MTTERPMFPPRADSADSISHQPAIRQREAACHLSESSKPAEGLSRRFVLAGVASAAALPMAATALPAQIPRRRTGDLGARFEPLVDRYYAAHRVWSAALAGASADNEREFPDADAGDRAHDPSIAAAFKDSCKRSGTD